MKIITLSLDKFTEFSKHHKYGNFYQTVNYARIMKTEGYDYHLFGFVNHSNELIGATMILYQKIFLNYKMAYAPFGFLMDYSNSDLVEEVTLRLKKILWKQRFIYLKINPNIHCSKRNSKGNILSYNPEVNDIMEIMQSNGYVHTGFNNYFENEKPRWNAVLSFTSSNENLYKNLSKQTRNKINKARRLGVECYQGTQNDLNTFYEFIKRKHNRSLKYYQSFLKEFGKNANIHLAKINTEKYVIQSQELYEQEVEKNEIYNQKLQELSKLQKDIKHIINKKMESDKNISIYQNDVIKATKLFTKYPNGIIIGGLLSVRYEKSMSVIIEGFDKKYRDFNCNYLLKWELIQRLNKEEYHYLNLNGIVGEFIEPNKYSGLNEMKLGFNANAIEYIGEFELVINKVIYNIYQKKLQKK